MFLKEGGGWGRGRWDNTMYKLRGLCPPNFFKILNSRYIFKILEYKLKKNYICPPQENYICPPRLRILIPSLGGGLRGFGVIF